MRRCTAFEMRFIGFLASCFLNKNTTMKAQRQVTIGECLAAVGAFFSALMIIMCMAGIVACGAIIVFGPPDARSEDCALFHHQSDCLSQCNCGWCGHANGTGACYPTTMSDHCQGPKSSFDDRSDCSTRIRESWTAIRILCFSVVIAVTFLGLNSALLRSKWHNDDNKIPRMLNDVELQVYKEVMNK
jgi:hypothetical protein